MAIKVLVVDDSVIFRSQIKASMQGEAGIEVVGAASNGKIALGMLETLNCDFVVLDLEMPDMGGIQFLAELRKFANPPRVIVFAAATRSGAEHVFEAIRAGAVDFIAKPTGVNSLEEALAGIRRELVPKLRQFVSPELSSVRSSLNSDSGKPGSPLERLVQKPVEMAKAQAKDLSTFRPSVVLIASSTGGPSALETIFSRLKGVEISVPILIAQHMPPNFTDCLAKRLGALCGMPAGEGRAGERVLPGQIYVAPGDFHMTVHAAMDGKGVVILLDQGPKRHQVRPSADNLIESAVKVYGAGCLSFTLTGMGEDGSAGARKVCEAGGAQIIQDRESCIVWGMPGAVHASSYFHAEMTLEQCADTMIRLASRERGLKLGSA